MINYFKKQCANKQSMHQVIHDNQEWTLCTITRWDEIEEGGGHPRAAYISNVEVKDNNPYYIGFDFLIPSEWIVNEDYVLIAELHARHVKGVPFAIYVTGDKLRAVVLTDREEAPAGDYQMSWIPDHPYQVRMRVNTSMRTYGFYDVEVNGQQWFRYDGRSTFVENDNPYWEFGPYQATPNWRDPTVDYRKLLIRV